MASEVERTGMTPEQKFGLAAGAAFAVAGLAMTVVRRKKKKSPVEQTTEKLLENPSVKNLYAAARKSLDEAKGKVDPKTFEAARKELERQQKELPERWHRDIEPGAKHLAELALQTAQKVRSEGAERGKVLSKRWEKEYGPAAKSFADEALHEADEILAAARKKATKISDTARKDYIPKIAPMATAASGAVAEKFATGSDAVQKKMKGGYKPDISMPKRSQPNLIKRTGQGALNFTSQLVMVTFWAAALGAVVYYALLNEEQREKVRSFFVDTWEQVNELIEDFQDEEIFDDGEGTEKF
jgi:HD-GYP domain-containing protein (c-di-GMP phosphodiesterase class II)